MENERRDASYFKETGSNAVPDAGRQWLALGEGCDYFFSAQKSILSKINLSQGPGPRYCTHRYQVYGTRCMVPGGTETLIETKNISSGCLVP